MKALYKVVFVVFLVVLICSACSKRSMKDELCSWIMENENMWEEMIADFSQENTTSLLPVEHRDYSRFYITPNINGVSYSPENHAFTLSFAGSYSGETSIKLLYCSSCIEIVKLGSQFFGDDAWELDFFTNHSYRWYGGGIDGSGYIYIECLLPKWYYVETYYPT